MPRSFGGVDEQLDPPFLFSRNASIFLSQIIAFSHYHLVFSSFSFLAKLTIRRQRGRQTSAWKQFQELDVGQHISRKP